MADQKNQNQDSQHTKTGDKSREDQNRKNQEKTMDSTGTRNEQQRTENQRNPVSTSWKPEKETEKEEPVDSSGQEEDTNRGNPRR